MPVGDAAIVLAQMDAAPAGIVLARYGMARLLIIAMVCEAKYGDVWQRGMRRRRCSHKWMQRQQVSCLHELTLNDWLSSPWFAKQNMAMYGNEGYSTSRCSHKW